MYDILMRSYQIGSKKDIRAFFNQLRQELLDWHNTVFNSPEFAAQEKVVVDFYTAKAVD